ncbi:MAG: hypothetical protein KDA81_11255 [Planctomycetaceae bacterium]|nr:hypothetical protein [Planctomycetaceae bacterium]
MAEMIGLEIPGGDLGEPHQPGSSRISGDLFLPRLQVHVEPVGRKSNDFQGDSEPSPA